MRTLKGRSRRSVAILGLLVLILGGVALSATQMTSPAPESRLTAPEGRSVVHDPVQLAKSPASEGTKQRVFRTDQRTGKVAEVVDPEAARVKMLLDEIIVNLTPEERNLLEKHPPDTLSQAISDADEAYRSSGDSNREELQQQYFALLNLAAKLAPRPAPMPPDEVERYRRYAQALEARKREFSRLSEKEAASLKETIKNEVFKSAQTGAHQQ